MIELLGYFPKNFSRRCSKFQKYFMNNGKLKRIPAVQQKPMKDFIMAEYIVA